MQQEVEYTQESAKLDPESQYEIASSELILAVMLYNKFETLDYADYYDIQAYRFAKS